MYFWGCFHNRLALESVQWAKGTTPANTGRLYPSCWEARWNQTTQERHADSCYPWAGTARSSTCEHRALGLGLLNSGKSISRFLPSPHPSVPQAFGPAWEVHRQLSWSPSLRLGPSYTISFLDLQCTLQAERLFSLHGNISQLLKKGLFLLILFLWRTPTSTTCPWDS